MDRVDRLEWLVGVLLARASLSVVDCPACQGDGRALDVRGRIIYDECGEPDDCSRCSGRGVEVVDDRSKSVASGGSIK